MADDPISQISTVTELIAKLEKAVGTITQGLNKLTESSADAANKGLAGVAAQGKKAASGLEDAAGAAKWASSLFGKLGEASDIIWESLNNVAAANVDFVKTGAQAVFMLNLLGKTSGDAKTAIAGLGDGFKDVSGSIAGFSEHLE